MVLSLEVKKNAVKVGISLFFQTVTAFLPKNSEKVGSFYSKTQTLMAEASASGWAEQKYTHPCITQSLLQLIILFIQFGQDDVSLN